MSKKPKKTFNFFIPIAIILVFVIGLFAPKIFVDSEEEIILSMAESMTTAFYAMTLNEDFTDIDIDFNHVKATLKDKESEHDPGLYVDIGEFTHDRKTYTFSHEIAFYDDIYMHVTHPAVEEK